MIFLRSTVIAAILLNAMTLLAQGEWLHMNVNANVQSITTKGDSIFVASLGQGVLRSTNDMASWSPVNTGIPEPAAIRSVGRSGNVLLAGATPLNGQYRVYRSLNGGESWETATTGLPAIAGTPNPGPYPKKFFHVNGVTLMVLSNTISAGGGIFRSTNNGGNWSIGHSGMSTNMVVYHLAWNASTIYAATSVGVLRSTDGALSWQQMGSVNYTSFSIQVVGQRLIAVTTFGILHTDDEGETWSPPAAGITGTPVRGELISYDGKLFASVGSSANAATVYRSLNNGLNFSVFQNGLEPVDQSNQNYFHASPDRLYLGALLDGYWLPGSSVDVQASDRSAITISPTIFRDGFTVDLSGTSTNMTLILTDASGRVCAEYPGLPATPVHIERGLLRSGLYHCSLKDPATGEMRLIGRIIAE